MNTNRHAALLAVGLALVLASCSKKDDSPSAPNEDPQTAIASCVGCHTDYQALRRLADPDTASGGGGCGGDIPHIAPYDRVYLSGQGYQDFRQSSHGVACTQCHGGVDNTADKRVAHSTGFLKHPSTRGAEKCGACHNAITTACATNIHNGWGQKSMVTLRYGAATYDALPASLKAGYDANCGKCHAGCGDCHVTRPYGGGGGVYQGHKFLRKPDMRNQCTACHSSRVGHAYFGVGSGTVPDVHSTRLGDGHCLNCHTQNELHGDGNVYDQRYKVPQLPTCTRCHIGISASNAYHTAHFSSFSCQTCHSQNYNNCGSCHIGGAGARVPAYLGFKIGINPIQAQRPYRFGLLRRSLMAPDSWQNYGVAQLAQFSVRPTYKYATPHNIQKWTSRTQVAQGRPCYDNCHVINEGGTYRNRSLYLFQSDLLPWEVAADTGVVVDGRLPSSWGVR